MARLKHIVRYLCIAILCIGILQSSFCVDAFAQNTRFDDGTWDYHLQGYRISVFDTIMGETVAIADWVKPNHMKDIPDSNIVRGCGSKLDYLYEFYANAETMDEISAFKAVELKTYSDKYADVYEFTYGSKYSSLWPVTMVEDKEYVTTRMLIDLIKNSDISMMSLLLLPHMFYCDPSIPEQFPDVAFEPLLTTHTLVFEPIYWFRVASLDTMYFYGTATEWMIFDTYKMRSDYGTGYVSGAWCDKNESVSYEMGLLTHNAGPLSLLPRKDYRFDVNGLTIPIEKIAVNDDTFNLLFRRNIHDYGGYYDYRGSYGIDALNMLIFKQFGVDFLTLKDVVGLTVDINGSNTSFRTGTDAVLSFEINNVSNISYLPPSVSEAGLELHLETLPSSDIKASDIFRANGTNEIVLYSSGVPGNKDDSQEVFTTDVFGDFRVPNKAGTWEFMLTVRDANMSDVPYFSNNGYLDDPEDNHYVFSVDIIDISTSQPPNTSSSDLMPYDFTVPASNLYQFGTPSTSTSWSYYTAHERTDPESGETDIYLVSHTKTAESSMGDVYYPYSYDNIASAKNRSVTNDTLITHSGYGIGINVTPSTSNAEGSGGYQNGIVLFPEYDYATYSMMIEPYGGMACDSNYNYSDWGYRLVQNTNSMYYGKPSKSDYSRVHFTPVWYPDGEYKIQVYMFDCWTPGGMLWDCREFTVTFRDSMYNDWYITR